LRSNVIALNNDYKVRVHCTGEYSKRY